MKKSRIKKAKFIITLLPAAIFCIVCIWLLMNIFEGEKPHAQIEPLPEYLSRNIDFNIHISDLKMGLREVKVSVKQNGQAIPILKKTFPYEGLFNKRGVHAFKGGFALDPKKLHLVQGQVNLIMEIHDFSKRRGGDGNLAILEHKMIVDTIPPSITPISRSHNVNIGGSGLIIYRISSDTEKSGILVDDLLFPGVPFNSNFDNGIYLCYFAFPYNFEKTTRLYLWAKDKADNETRKTFLYHIRQKRFRVDKIRLSDRLLDSIVASFPPDTFNPDNNNLEKYLFLNRELRKENAALLQELCQSPVKEKLWDGPWLRMKNAATMARFADKRIYYYKGKEIDSSAHMGIDLASLANSPVQAANAGKVVFARDFGIYGMTIIIDHGQGLFTMYSHLSRVDVSVDQLVNKGDIIGATGTTGLATGDHLHFGFIIHGVPVNPIEWWDSHWIKDNIYRKFSRVDKSAEK